VKCLRGPKGRRRPERNETGSVLVEFAFVFALFVLVIYAVICFGMILATKNSLTHAAAEGARAAISVLDDPSTPAVDEREARALDQVGIALDWLGSKYDPSDASADVGACDPAVPAGPQCITVSITYPYGTRPIVPPAPGLGLVTPSTLTSTAVVELS
jgi:Flp pilus assembly protein TadG